MFPILEWFLKHCRGPFRKRGSSTSLSGVTQTYIPQTELEDTKRIKFHSCCFSFFQSVLMSVFAAKRQYIENLFPGNSELSRARTGSMLTTLLAGESVLCMFHVCRISKDFPDLNCYDPGCVPSIEPRKKVGWKELGPPTHMGRVGCLGRYYPAGKLSFFDTHQYVGHVLWVFDTRNFQNMSSHCHPLLPAIVWDDHPKLWMVSSIQKQKTHWSTTATGMASKNLRPMSIARKKDPVWI